MPDILRLTGQIWHAFSVRTASLDTVNHRDRPIALKRVRSINIITIRKRLHLIPKLIIETFIRVNPKNRFQAILKPISPIEISEVSVFLTQPPNLYLNYTIHMLSYQSKNYQKHIKLSS